MSKRKADETLDGIIKLSSYWEANNACFES